MKSLIPLLQLAIVCAIPLIGAFLLLHFHFGKKKGGAYLQLLYLIRYPLIFAAILLIFPLFAVTSNSEMLTNIFIFDTIGAVVLVMVIGLLMAWSVMYTLRLVLYEMSKLYHLPEDMSILKIEWETTWAGKYRAALFALLVVPLALVIIVQAEIDRSDALTSYSVTRAIFGIVLGVLAASLVYWVCWRLLAVPWVKRRIKNLRVAMKKLLDFLRVPQSIREGFTYRDDTRLYHETATIFLFFLGLLYLAGGILFSPDRYWVGVIPQPPAAVYLLSLFLILTWLLSGLAHLVDRYRVPTTLLILLLLVLVANISDTNHYYRIVQAPPTATATIPATTMPLAEVEATATPQVVAAEAMTTSPQAAVPVFPIQPFEKVQDGLDITQTNTITRAPFSFTSTFPLPNEIFIARQDYQVAQATIRAGLPRAANEPPPPLVIIMASGGGISAAVWTAQVLTGLQEHLDWRFVNAIGLISAVSGGAVGAMYYVDGFTKAGPPPDSYLPQIVSKAGESTVEQAAWGLTYPDLGRTFFLTALVPGHRFADRSWAMETAWQGRLDALADLHNKAEETQITADRAKGITTTFSFTDTHVPTTTRMLLDWQQGVTDGWRPATIFNATEAETGERFLFATAQIPVTWTTRSFYNAFPGYDISVATAARMAATFPYITPLAHAYLSDNDLNIIAGRLGLTETVVMTKVTGATFVTSTRILTHTEQIKNWNLADGGYFDNDGVVTALQWLEMNLATYSETVRPRRVVLIQILDSPRTTAVERCDADLAAQQVGSEAVYSKPDNPPELESPTLGRSWVDELFGPVLTLLSTWGTSQIERGQNEVDHFIDLKRRQYHSNEPTDDLQILYCVFDLRPENALSWQLAPSQFTNIIKAWTDDPERIEPRIQQIGQFLGIPTK